MSRSLEGQIMSIAVTILQDRIEFDRLVIEQIQKQPEKAATATKLKQGIDSMSTALKIIEERWG